MDRLIAIGIAFAFVCSAHSAQSEEKPSFDCRASRTQVEQIICSSSTLSKLDRQLAIAYRALPKGLLSIDQRDWLKQRDFCFSGAEAECIENLYRERLETLDALREFNLSDDAEKADALELLKTALACPNPVREGRIESTLTRTTYTGNGETLSFVDEIESVWVKGSAVGDYESSGKRSKYKHSTSVKFSDLTIAVEGDNAVSMGCRAGDCVRVAKNGMNQMQNNVGLQGCDKKTTKNIRDAVNYLILSNRVPKP